MGSQLGAQVEVRGLGPVVRNFSENSIFYQSARPPGGLSCAQCQAVLPGELAASQVLFRCCWSGRVHVHACVSVGALSMGVRACVRLCISVCVHLCPPRAGSQSPALVQELFSFIGSR